MTQCRMDISRRHLILVFFVALLGRTVYVARVGTNERVAFTPDTPTYMTPTLTLLQHGVFATEDKAPFPAETGRTPGFSPFLLPFFMSGDFATTSFLIFQ